MKKKTENQLLLAAGSRRYDVLGAAVSSRASQSLLCCFSGEQDVLLLSSLPETSLKTAAKQYGMTIIEMILVIIIIPHSGLLVPESRLCRQLQIRSRLRPVPDHRYSLQLQLQLTF